MIAAAVEFVRKEVRKQLGVTDAEVVAAAARTLADESASPGVYLSLIKLQEETTLRNTRHVESYPPKEKRDPRYLEPPVFLNLHLLFAFNFPNYSTSLVHLSKTIELFQNKRWFAASTQTEPDAVTFPPTLEKLVFAMVDLSFEELNNLWSMLGGTHLPSVIYELRLIKIQRVEIQPAPPVKVIDLRSAPRLEPIKVPE